MRLHLSMSILSLWIFLYHALGLLSISSAAPVNNFDRGVKDEFRMKILRKIASMKEEKYEFEEFRKELKNLSPNSDLPDITSVSPNGFAGTEIVMRLDHGVVCMATEHVDIENGGKSYVRTLSFGVWIENEKAEKEFHRWDFHWGDGHIILADMNQRPRIELDTQKREEVKEGTKNQPKEKSDL
jgi:hypothetical protein